MSKSRPSRPTRRWRNRTDPSETLTASASAIMSGEQTRAASAARTTRSSAYLTANCQPAGCSGAAPSSGSAAEVLDRQRGRSTVSNRRGTSETSMPSCSQRWTIRKSTSLGAVEKVTITWPMPCRRDAIEVPARAEHRQLRRAVTSRRAVPCRGSRRAAGRAQGASSRRAAVLRPTWPAPMIRVGTRAFASPPRV